jgi:hypothetical protein
MCALTMRELHCVSAMSFRYQQCNSNKERWLQSPAFFLFLFFARDKASLAEALDRLGRLTETLSLAFLHKGEYGRVEQRCFSHAIVYCKLHLR